MQFMRSWEESFQQAVLMKRNKQDRVICFFLNPEFSKLDHSCSKNCCLFHNFHCLIQGNDDNLLIIWNSLHVNQLKEIDLM